MKLLKSYILKNSLVKFSSKFSKNFSKKTTKPTSGSDVEADKTKKTVRGTNENNNVSNDKPTSQTTQNSQTSSTTSSSSNEKGVKIPFVNSVEGHKCPFSEDTISGRYAQTLFIAASKANELNAVFNDMTFIRELNQNSVSFKLFTENAGLNANQVNSFVEEMVKTGDLCKTTVKFIDLLAKNKRFMYIDQIALKFKRAYMMLSNEEKINIISAYELSSQEKDKVRSALEQNPENKGKTFIIDFTVNPSILGGLQMYSENKFMDLSLNSRIDKLKDEVNKML